ncbi:MAG: serine protease [Candidatus Omnitrophota bacterium]
MQKLGFIIYFLLLSTPSLSWAQENSLIAQMQNIQSSLVEIKTTFSRTLRTPKGTGLASYERHGAGIIIDSSGIIVTNTHIIRNAPHIFVSLANGKTFKAKVILANEADFSFLKINTHLPLKPITWADSSLAQLGEPIIAIGGSSDLNHQSILGGKITSLIESKSSGNIELLELNVNLYEGDSGGPILNRQGHLLGLIMAKRKKEDRKSYAIASNKIRREYLKYKQNMP